MSKNKTNKSFKDYYIPDKEANRGAIVEEPSTMTVLETQPKDSDDTITESIRDIITEQQDILREESAKLLGSVIETNKALVESINSVVKNNKETNETLIESIGQLINKVKDLETQLESISLLEAKIDAIKDIQIPTPIVNITIPSKKIRKEVHRDGKGFITHITEESVLDDTDEPETFNPPKE